MLSEETIKALLRRAYSNLDKLIQAKGQTKSPTPAPWWQQGMVFPGPDPTQLATESEASDLGLASCEDQLAVGQKLKQLESVQDGWAWAEKQGLVLARRKKA